MVACDFPERRHWHLIEKERVVYSLFIPQKVSIGGDHVVRQKAISLNDNGRTVIASCKEGIMQILGFLIVIIKELNHL